MAKTKLGHGLTGIVLAIWTVSGCGSHSTSGEITDAPAHIYHRPTAGGSPSSSTGSGDPAAATENPANLSAGPRATRRPANVKGKVFILEYHHIRPGKNNYYRTADEFRGDLVRLYKDGFRPCTVSQYLENKMDLPPGASPAVFTFDDAIPTQLKLRPDGSLDPGCALGIWAAFAKTHPDFPIRATFYVLPDTMWGQPKLKMQKVELVRKLGCELGNHTVTHPILKRLSDDKVKWEIATATDDLVKLGTPLPVSLALPFGVSPKNKQLLHSFDYDGKTYAMKAVLLVGAEPARSPVDPKFDRYRIPRVQAYDGPLGINEWLDRFEKGEVKVYVAP